jgi:hypothetical protein
MSTQQEREWDDSDAIGYVVVVLSIIFLVAIVYRLIRLYG